MTDMIVFVISRWVLLYPLFADLVVADISSNGLFNDDEPLTATLNPGTTNNVTLRWKIPEDFYKRHLRMLIVMHHARIPEQLHYSLEWNGKENWYEGKTRAHHGDYEWKTKVYSSFDGNYRPPLELTIPVNGLKNLGAEYEFVVQQVAQRPLGPEFIKIAKTAINLKPVAPKTGAGCFQMMTGVSAPAPNKRRIRIFWKPTVGKYEMKIHALNDQKVGKKPVYTETGLLNAGLTWAVIGNRDHRIYFKSYNDDGDVSKEFSMVHVSHSIIDEIPPTVLFMNKYKNNDNETECVLRWLEGKYYWDENNIPITNYTIMWFSVTEGVTGEKITGILDFVYVPVGQTSFHMKAYQPMSQLTLAISFNAERWSSGLHFAGTKNFEIVYCDQSPPCYEKSIILTNFFKEDDYTDE